jgi:hypothetical protein
MRNRCLNKYLLPENGGNGNDLRLPFLPGRLDAEQTAAILGFEGRDIPILVQCGLLVPLGNPAQNARKYFEKNIILQLRENSKWMNNATNAVYDYWKGKNSRKTANNLSKETMLQTSLEA